METLVELSLNEDDCWQNPLVEAIISLEIALAFEIKNYRKVCGKKA